MILDQKSSGREVYPDNPTSGGFVKRDLLRPAKRSEVGTGHGEQVEIEAEVEADIH